jgi:hypothetical protein
VKTALAFTITSGVCLLSYEGLARRTALGRWLGFSWQPPSASDDQGTVISIDASASDQSASDRSPLPAARKAA